jgi:hypothetical protein
MGSVPVHGALVETKDHPFGYGGAPIDPPAGDDKEVQPSQLVGAGSPVGYVPVHARWASVKVPSACLLMALVSGTDVSWVKLRATVVRFESGSTYGTELAKKEAAGLSNGVPVEIHAL